MAQLCDHGMRLAAYSTLDTGYVIAQLYNSISAIWKQRKSRVLACNIMHQYMTYHPHGELNPCMPTEIVLDAVFDVMMVGHRHWNVAQWALAVRNAINAMHLLSKQLDNQRIFDINRTPEEIAMDAILAGRLAAEAEAARAAEHAGMTWSEWPPEEPWDNGY